MEPKNLIVLVSDEHSRRYSGCYGDPIAKTPNIDRLAASGTRFSRAYTPSPICTAARASLATGLWVHQTGCNSSVEAYDGTIPSWGHHLIEAGHQVVSFGKIGYLRANSSNGFSREFLPIHNLNGLGWMGGLLRDPVYIPDDAVEAQEFANHIGCGESDYTKYDRAVCDTACAWMRANGDSQDRPWVMFVSFISPHYPLIAPKEFYDLYDEEVVGLPHRQDALPDHPVMQEYRRFFNFNDHLDERLTRQARRAYYGLCSFTDYLIGRVMSTLETQGLSEETRILYTSDHGEMLGNHGTWTKMLMYEDAVAIPMILAGGGVPRGKVADTPVSLVDCYPTIIESVGDSLTGAEQELPGTSLFAIADGDEPKRCLISEYHDGGMSTGIFMLLKDPWKYIHYPGHRPQLFNLLEDPLEDVDLAEDPRFAPVLKECESALREILDPDAVNERVFAKQAEIIESYGGYHSVAAMEESNMFIELDALYVNAEELRTPAEVNVRR
jgi:choline-sulfatase